MKKIVLITAIFAILTACQEKKSFDDLNTFSKNDKPHFIVMNPAGSVENYEYDNETNGFKVYTEDGEYSSVDFMPFPANFGFFPSTHKGGEDQGELLYGFLITQEYSIQTLLEVKPIGAVSVIRDGNEMDYIITIPDEESLRVNKSETLTDDMKNIFSIWLTNAYGIESIVQWHNEDYASELIKSRSNR
jgi:inorganic pyrophosphatase